MRSVSIKDIIEYISASVIIIIELFIILSFYQLVVVQAQSLKSYQIFVQSLYADRLHYCTYSATGNPYYLFYLPDNKTIYENKEKIDKCYSSLKGNFAVTVSNESTDKKVEVEFWSLESEIRPFFFLLSLNNISYYYFYTPINIEYNSLEYGARYVHYIINNTSLNIFERNKNLSEKLITEIFEILKKYKENITESIFNFEKLLSSMENIYIEGFTQYNLYTLQSIEALPVFVTNYENNHLMFLYPLGIGNIYNAKKMKMECDVLSGSVKNCKLEEIR